MPVRRLIKILAIDGGGVRGIILPFRRPRYQDNGIETVLRERFGATYLSESRTHVIITAYDMTFRAPKVFLSWEARKTHSEDFLMRDIARATTAAPTYFSPVNIPDRANNNLYHLVDGGVFANNPAARGFVEAVGHLTASGTPAAECEYLLVSLGTGSLKRTYRYDDTRNWGLVDWARPILDVVFDGVSENVDHQLHNIFEAGLRVGRYFRFQGDLDAASDDMDNTSKVNLQRLHELAGSIYHRQQKDYMDLKALLEHSLGAPPAHAEGGAVTAPSAAVAPAAEAALAKPN